jgi:hypothetical protein
MLSMGPQVQALCFKGWNEVPNVGRTKGLELIYHLVKFLTGKFSTSPSPFSLNKWSAKNVLLAFKVIGEILALGVEET